MIITQQIKIHLDKRFLETPTVEAVQGESTRAVEFQLYNGGTEWTVPEGTTVTVRYRIFHEGAFYSSTYDTLPDGSPAYCVDGSSLTVYLPTEVLSIWGVGELQIGLFNGDSTTTLFSVLVRVEQDFAFDGATPAVHHDVSIQLHSAVNQWADRNYGGGGISADDLNTLREDTEAYVTEELAKRGQLKPLFADSISECSDPSKLYVLPDGYIYAYMTTEIEAANLFDPSAATLNVRLSSSGTPVYNGLFITDFIPVDTLTPNVDKFYVSNVTSGGAAGSGINPSITSQYCGYYTADKTLIERESFGTTASGSNALIEKADNGSTIFWPLTSTANATNIIASGNVAYVRFCFAVNSTQTAITAADIATVSIQLNEGSVGKGWANTGHAFVPADYESRIVALEAQTAKLEGAQSNTTAVPAYWQSAVDAAVSKVKTLQDVGGADVVNFMWFSDMHHNTGNPYTENIGTLCAAVMNECNIPLCLMSGDTMSADSVAEEATLLAWLENAAEVLSPIGADRLMQIRGNHDDVYGSYTTGSATNYYVNKVSSAKIWNRMHRAQAQDFRRVFGGDGTYFYLDNVPQKIRFICLNCQYYDGGGITNGTTGSMTFGLGTAQLEWLENAALSVEAGWGVVIATHVPPTAEAVNGRTDYLSLYGDDGASFRTIITSTTADIIGIFCGHCHADAIISEDLPCPILTVTCAINTPYDGTAAKRIAGTDMETALDIVSINKTTRTIHTTRLGAGEDRTIHY